MFYYLSKEKYGFCDTKKRSQDIWLAQGSALCQHPICDLIRKLLYREQKENRAPWILSFTAPRI